MHWLTVLQKMGVSGEINYSVRGFDMNVYGFISVSDGCQILLFSLGTVTAPT